MKWNFEFWAAHDVHVQKTSSMMRTQLLRLHASICYFSQNVYFSRQVHVAPF